MPLPQRQPIPAGVFWIAGFGILAALIWFLWFKSPAEESGADIKAGYFNINLGTEPPTLDPAEMDDLVSMTIVSNIMRGLVQYGPSGDIEPAVAASWTMSPDGKRYVFHLRKNALWSDGKAVTAQDFVYAWRRVLNPKTGSPYAFLLFDVENAKATYEGKLNDPEQIGIHALDSETLEIRLHRPVAYFMQILAFSITLPLRHDNVEKNGDAFTEAGKYITNGPYRLSRWEHENEIILTPNPTYWAGTPPNKGVQFLMIPEPNTSLILYENRELDFIETPSSMPIKEVRRLSKREDYHQQGLHAVSYFGFNTEKPPFDNPKVRQAFAHGFDRTYIPRIFKDGSKPISSWIPPGLFASNPEIGLKFDPAKGKQLLAEAGYSQGKDFPKVELLVANTTPENRQVAEIAQYQWEQNLGVHIDVRNVEWKVFLKQLDTDPPAIFRLQWFADYPDPDSFLNVFISQSGNNHTRWTDPRYDDWIYRGAVELNPVTRKALYDKAQKLLLEDATAITPVVVIPKSYLLRPGITGFALNALNIVTLDHLHLPDTAASVKRDTRTEKR